MSELDNASYMGKTSLCCKSWLVYNNIHTIIISVVERMLYYASGSNPVT